MLGIYQLDTSLPLPEYKTDGSIGLDLYVAHRDWPVPAGAVVVIPNGIVVRPSPGHFTMVVARSSTALKHNLMVANGVGIIDADYCGPHDEVGTIVYNFGPDGVLLRQGDRISQMIVFMASQQSIYTMDKPTVGDRGGMGSTGT